MSILSWALKKELLFAYSQILSGQNKRIPDSWLVTKGLILLSKEGHKDVEAQGICALTATLYSSWGSLFLGEALARCQSLQWALLHPGHLSLGLLPLKGSLFTCSLLYCQSSA